MPQDREFTYDERDTINEIYDCAVMWRSEDADNPDTPPAAWQKAYPLMMAAPDLLKIAIDILPECDDYGDGRHCDECGTAKSQPDQTQCDVPGCFYVRIRAAIAKATE